MIGRRPPHRWFPARTRRRAQAGFSLVELVIGMTLAAFLSGSAALLVITATDLSETAAVKEDVILSAVMALERFERDVREARGGSALDILVTTSTRFVFVDRQGVTIDWQLIGSIWTRNGDDMLDDVSSLELTYWDRSGGAVAIGRPPGRIDVKLKVVAQSVTVNMAESVLLRNLDFPFAGWRG